MIFAFESESRAYGGNATSNGMDLTEILELLTDPSRRQLLCELDDQTLLHESNLSGVDTGTALSFQTAMHHNHLPKLDESGVIDYDRRAKTIVKGPAFEEVKSVLDSVQDERPAAAAG